MGLSCRVGGAQVLFEGRLANEVAGALDQAFGEGDWEAVEARGFGELEDANWSDFRDRACEELGLEEVPNLLALGNEARVIFMPANVQAMTIKLPSAAGSLRCASLPGLRRELYQLAERWDLTLEDRVLEEILQVADDPDDGPVADAPEVVAFARLALAANEAMRRDCPLWLVGS
jgi:hypothetical protein